MGQLDELQRNVNKRATLNVVGYRSSLIGYDDDPNSPSAPDILKNCPPGTQYQRDSNGNSYIKNTSDATSWTRVRKWEDPDTSTTTGAMAPWFDPTAADIRPKDYGVVFSNQDDIDAWYTAQGVTAFRHFMDFIECLPPRIAYLIRLRCREGTHLLRDGGAHDQWGNDRFILIDDYFTLVTGDPTVDSDNEGRFVFEGNYHPGQYEERHAGGSVTAFQNFDEVTGEPEPYLDFAASTFPNDGSLIGLWAVWESASWPGSYESALIYDHTDSRLYLIESPYDLVVGSSVNIRAPSVIWQNTTDVAGWDDGNSRPVEYSPVNLTNEDYYGLDIQGVTLRPYEGTNGAISITGNPVELDRVMMEKGPQQIGFVDMLSGRDVSRVRFQDVSNRQAVGDGGYSLNVVGRGSGSEVWVVKSVFYGGDDGGGVIAVQGSGYVELNLLSSAFVDTAIPATTFSFGRAIVDAYECRVSASMGSTTIPNYWLRNTTNVPALVIGPGPNCYPLSTDTRSELGAMMFKDQTGPCVRLTWNAVIDLTNPPNANIWGYPHDRGGNSDVGWDIYAGANKLILPAATDATGTVGDIRLPDGSIKTYAQIAGGAQFARGNYLEQ